MTINRHVKIIISITRLCVCVCVTFTIHLTEKTVFSGGTILDKLVLALTCVLIKQENTLKGQMGKIFIHLPDINFNNHKQAYIYVLLMQALPVVPR